MELLLRVQYNAADRVRQADLRVEVEPTHTIGALSTAVAERLGVRNPGPVPLTLVRDRTGAALPVDQTVADCGLLSGELLGLGGAGALVGGTHDAPRRGVRVDILAGPDAGRSLVLGAGTHLVGRHPGCAVELSDPSVSRQHAWIEISDALGATVVPDPSASNPVRVDGEPVDDRHEVNAANVIEVGASALAIRPYEQSAPAALDLLGQIPFQRTPYRPSPIDDRKFDPLGEVPTTPEPQKFQYLAAVLPLAGGIIMAFFFGPRFLLFTLLAPLTAGANFFENRKQRRVTFERSLARFRRRLGERANALRAALVVERARRLRSAPDVADLGHRAELRTTDLWSRGRDAEAFLALRVGIGDIKPAIEVNPDTQGDDALKDDIEAVNSSVSTLRSVPVALPLAELGIAAIEGADDDTIALTNALLMQAACLHSPEDLIVLAAVTPERSIEDWLKWLPHTRSATSPLAGPHVVMTKDDANRLLRALIEVTDLRRSQEDRNHDRRWPWLLLLVDVDIDADAALVSQLLDRCPECGVSVLWLTDSEARIPRQARAVVRAEPLRSGRRSMLWFSDPAREFQAIVIERVHRDTVDRVARALAPVRDASVANATTAIPRTVPLYQALGTESVDTRWITERWSVDRGYSLAAPIGMTADGPFELDLVAQGPHGLIGGTSGAGKSELLQSIVASLIAHYPPTRLNILFVDYKGGAASTVFKPVPHTVGYVTNLDASLSLRALVSLRAELNRRMRLLENRAKDLEEMLAKFPEDAPPSLVIIVDEFATLVKEVPEFVAGIVDIAQRGRSLGIHLILATQRPSGSVNDNILANTNLRISLRMLDAGESSSIIGSPEAADIPVPLRGRGFARLGPRELTAFQSAYSGAPASGVRGPVPVLVHPFGSAESTAAPRSARSAGSTTTTGQSQLDMLIESVVAATDQMHYERGRQPWMEMLPDHVRLADVRTHPSAAVTRRAPGRLLAFGMLDDPESQDQYPAVVDLEDGGGLLVFGSGGSGKTTLLRTLALSAAVDDALAGGGNVTIFALDFASRSLVALDALEQCSAVATGDDLEAVTRIIALLSAELERRTQLMSARERTGGGDDDLARVIVIVDGYSNLASTFMNGTGSDARALQEWFDRFHRVVVDGRQVGIFTVITADRRAAVPALIMSAIANRVVLRQAESSGLMDLGVDMHKAAGLELIPGRGFFNGDMLLQVAVISTSADAAAQNDTLRHAAQNLASAPAPELRTAPLPASARGIAGAKGHLRVVVGLADLTLAPVEIDLEYTNALVVGPTRSGRSTALLRFATDLAANEHEVWVVGPANSALRDFPGAAKSAFGRAGDLAPVLGELQAMAESYQSPIPRILVFDDLDTYDDMSLQTVCGTLATVEGLRIVAAIEPRNFAGYTTNDLLAELRRSRRLLFLQPDSGMDIYNQTGVRAQIRPGLAMPAGRGILIADRGATIVQVLDPATG